MVFCKKIFEGLAKMGSKSQFKFTKMIVIALLTD